MSAFITIEDYDASIRTEILDAITRNDPAMIEVTEDRAIEEIWGYLSQRFDCNAIFQAVGNARNNVILMFAIDITLYHLHAVYNPMRFPEIRKERYARAIDYLKAVQKGQVLPTNLPQLANEEGATGDAKDYYFSSNKKRTNHF